MRDHRETAAALRAKAAAEGVTAAEAQTLIAKARQLEAAHPASARPESVQVPQAAPLTGMTLSEALFGRRSSRQAGREAGG